MNNWIKQLREDTGCSIRDAVLLYNETDGDEELAKEILKEPAFNLEMAIRHVNNRRAKEANTGCAE